MKDDQDGSLNHVHALDPEEVLQKLDTRRDRGLTGKEIRERRKAYGPNQLRPMKEAVLTRRHWLSIGGWSMVIAACVLGGLALAIQWLDMPAIAAVTVSFLTLAFAKLFFVFELRDRGSRIWDNDVVRNPWIWASMALCTALLVMAVYLPGLSDVLRTEPLGLTPWLLVLALSMVPFLLVQMLRVSRRFLDGGSHPEGHDAKRAGGTGRGSESGRETQDAEARASGGGPADEPALR